MTTSTMSSPISSNLEPTARSRDRHVPTGERKTSLLWSAPRRKAMTMARMHAPLRSSVLAAFLIVVAVARAKAEDLNDYPTSARADYVFGCMQANAETH